MGSYKQDRLAELGRERDRLYRERDYLDSHINRLTDLIDSSDKHNPGRPGWFQERKNLRFQRGVVSQAIRDIKQQMDVVRRS